jgi:hypothetical protein
MCLKKPPRPLPKPCLKSTVIDLALEDELFGLIHAHSACYLLGMENCPRYPRGPLAIGGIQLGAKAIFDGTKLPLVVRSSRNHNKWYRVTFS